MKKTFIIIGLISLGLLSAGKIFSATTKLQVPGGGTGSGSFPANALVVGAVATNTGPLTSTTSPTVGYITSTSTATSTFGGGINATTGCFAINAVCVGGSGLTGSGSANRATYWTSGTNLSYDDQFVWNPTTNQLQIGSVSPPDSGHFLTVSGAAANLALITTSDDNHSIALINNTNS